MVPLIYPSGNREEPNDKSIQRSVFNCKRSKFEFFLTMPPAKMKKTTTKKSKAAAKAAPKKVAKATSKKVARKTNTKAKGQAKKKAAPKKKITPKQRVASKKKLPKRDAVISKPEPVSKPAEPVLSVPSKLQPELVWVGEEFISGGMDGSVAERRETYLFSTRRKAEVHGMNTLDNYLGENWCNGLKGFGREKKKVENEVEIEVSESSTRFHIVEFGDCHYLEYNVRRQRPEDQVDHFDGPDTYPPKLVTTSSSFKRTPRPARQPRKLSEYEVETDPEDRTSSEEEYDSYSDDYY